MWNAPVMGFFTDPQSGQLAADALRSSGFNDIRFSTAEDFNAGLIEANPKHNQWHMEKTFLGIVVGVIIGAIFGWLMGLALGKVWAAIGAVVLACIGAALGLLIADRHTSTYENILRSGGVLLIVNFANSARVQEAIDILRRSGAREVSANRPGDSPDEGS